MSAYNETDSDTVTLPDDQKNQRKSSPNVNSKQSGSQAASLRRSGASSPEIKRDEKAQRERILDETGCL